jgi:hypothetical protein
MDSLAMTGVAAAILIAILTATQSVWADRSRIILNRKRPYVENTKGWATRPEDELLAHCHPILGSS